MSVAVLLLGNVLLIRDETPVAIGGGFRGAVLARLALQAPDVVSTAALIDALWGERPPKSAVNALHVHVTTLRKLGGRDLIQRVGGGYMLGAHVGSDVSMMQADVVRGRQHLSDGRADLASAAFSQALSRWRGPSLVDVYAAAFAHEEGVRLDELRMDVTELSFAARLATGEHAELIAPLTELVKAEPFRETLQAHLMLALYRSGRQADALAAYTAIRTLLVEDLGVDPSPELVALEQRILRQDPDLTGPTQHPLVRRYPTPINDLIGREAELNTLMTLLQDGARLVTLTGPGGVGKTRLMLAMAERISVDRGQDYEEILFIDLSALKEADLVLPTLANALGIAERADQTFSDVVSTALERRRFVLLLDNWERVIDASPELAHLLAGCPHLQVVVTSRQRLSLRGEHEYVVMPLALPDVTMGEVADIARFPAVRLFTDRAQTARRDFVVTERNAVAVAELCRRLDGLPLALELAAARTKLLSPSALLNQLDHHRQRVLSGGARDLPERHRALHATIAWTYDDLAPVEQLVLQACSVFAGGASLEALESVCAIGEGEDLFEVVNSLVDKSLLTRSSTDTDALRVDMLETVQVFAAERLDSTGDAALAQDRHARYFGRLVSDATSLYWEDHDRWLDTLERDLDNIRAALQWSFSNALTDLTIRMLWQMRTFWGHSSAGAEGIAWMTKALTKTSPATLGGAAMSVLLAVHQMAHGDLNDWVARLPAAVARLREDGDPVEYCWSLMVLSDSFYELGRPVEALATAEEAVTVARGDAPTALLSRTLAVFGVLTAEMGDIERGLQLLIEADALFPPSNRVNRHHQGVLLRLGWVEIRAGQHEQARNHLLAALRGGANSARDREMRMLMHGNLGWATLGTGQHQVSLSHFVQAIKLFEPFDDPLNMAEALVGLACAAAASQSPTLPAMAIALADEWIGTTATNFDPYVIRKRAECIAAGDPQEIPHVARESRAYTALDLALAAESLAR